MAPAWRKSSYSGKENCVEIARGVGRVSIRDSKRPEEAHLEVGIRAFRSLTKSIKAA